MRDSSERGLSVARKGILLIVLSVLAVGFLLPFAWMVLTSLKSPSEVFTRTFPSTLRWSNYREVFTQPTFPFVRFFLNSIFVTGFCTVGSLLVSSVVGFAFARLKFAGRDFLFMVVLATMMVPGAVTMIPSFFLFQKLGWVDTLLPLTVPSLAGSAFQIFFLRQFFKTLPEELFEAARLDGCTNLRACFSIAIPLAKATLTTLAIFCVMGCWNDFMGPLIYLQSTEKKTLALGLATFSSTYGTEWHLLMAASTLALLPILVLFFTCQRYFERGLVMSGIKG